MNSRLKEIIFDKLYNDLKYLEIIPYGNSIWFIDRKEKYWYLEYEKSGKLWWRWQFFSKFFELFSMESSEYVSLISEWVEEVLNCKVETSTKNSGRFIATVEEVLNCKVETSINQIKYMNALVEEVLNCKVEVSFFDDDANRYMVELALDCKVKTYQPNNLKQLGLVGQVLNNKDYQNEQ